MGEHQETEVPPAGEVSIFRARNQNYVHFPALVQYSLNSGCRIWIYLRTSVYTTTDFFFLRTVLLTNEPLFIALDILISKQIGIDLHVSKILNTVYFILRNC